MSYCRLGSGSDVYVYEANDGLTCCFCRLSEDGFDAFICETHEAMIMHLAAHRRAGHRVPEYAVLELWKDIPEGEVNTEGANTEDRPMPMTEIDMTATKDRIAVFFNTRITQLKAEGDEAQRHSAPAAAQRCAEKARDLAQLRRDLLNQLFPAIAEAP